MEGERKKNKIMQLLEGAIISLTAGTHNGKKKCQPHFLYGTVLCIFHNLYLHKNCKKIQ